MPHCAGRQSFAQLRAKKAKDGVEPSRAEIFLDTHKDRKTRGKNKIDEESAKAAELMREKLDELPNGIEKMNGKIAWKGDIFDQVIGKEERHGRVCGVGGGVCAKKLWGRCDANQSSNYVENNRASSEELLLKLENDMKVMEEKHSEEMRAMQEKRDMELKEIMDKQNNLDSHLSQLINLFTQRSYGKSVSNAVDSSHSSEG